MATALLQKRENTTVRKVHLKKKPWKVPSRGKAAQHGTTPFVGRVLTFSHAPSPSLFVPWLRFPVPAPPFPSLGVGVPSISHSVLSATRFLRLVPPSPPGSGIVPGRVFQFPTAKTQLC